VFPERLRETAPGRWRWEAEKLLVGRYADLIDMVVRVRAALSQAR
jgi:hypothetical protein